jgi:hypothetical protein
MKNNIASAVVLLGLASISICTAQTLSTSAQLTAQGSTPIHRSQTDMNTGLVVIYTGGFLPANTEPFAFRFIFDLTTLGNTSGYLTPLLFSSFVSNSDTIYTVVGIGKGFEVKLSATPQTIPFYVVEGEGIASNGSYSFGFINAIVSTSGIPVATSPGVVDFDNPADTGNGVGGSETTNNWAATRFTPPIVVTLGTTFGPPGSSADYSFYLPYRTYSAEIAGVF